jgi:hypothetical protein
MDNNINSNRMKHFILITLITILTFVKVYGQGIIGSINNSYQSLDTIQYILDIKSAVRKDIETEWEEWGETSLKLDTSICNRKFVNSNNRKVYLME